MNRQAASAPLAQLAEHLTLNQAVEGSIPSRRIVNSIHCESHPTQFESRVRYAFAEIWAGAGIGRQDRLRIYWGYAS